MAILSVQDVSVRFGGIIALDHVSFEIEPRQIVGLIGPNGAGKTTLFNCVSRLYDVTSGAITFDGTALLATPPHRIAGLGIGRTFQNLALFPTQTVLQNVMIGAHSRTRSDFLSNALKLGWVGREEAECRTFAEELLRTLADDGMAVVVVDHDLDALATIADRAVVLHHGTAIPVDDLSQRDDANDVRFGARFLSGAVR